jgi:hypothetical protein
LLIGNGNSGNSGAGGTTPRPSAALFRGLIGPGRRGCRRQVAHERRERDADGFEHASGAARRVGAQQYAGKPRIVVGSNSSAHDVCAELWEQGADVTMVQRSPTTAVKSETLMEVGFANLYSDETAKKGFTIERADLTFASIPFRLGGHADSSLPDDRAPGCRFSMRGLPRRHFSSIGAKTARV